MPSNDTNIKKYSLFLLSTFYFLLALQVHAAIAEDFPSLVGVLVGYISQITLILMGVALLVFFAGVARYISNRGDKSALEEGKRTIGYGVVALFVLASLFGILTLLGDSIGIELRTGLLISNILI